MFEGFGERHSSTVYLSMAKPLIFQLGDQEYPLHLQKVDRSKLYGSKEVEALDDREQLCELATLADDGCTLIGKGGTGLGWVDADGKWREKSELSPHNVDGDEVRPVPSSFSAPIKLFDTATEEDLLDHNIRLVYSLRFDGPSDSSGAASDLADLQSELARGTIFKFPYSYRGGLEADVAFMLQNESAEIMLIVGNPTEVSFLAMQSKATVPDTDDVGDESADSVDFGMI